MSEAKQERCVVQSLSGNSYSTYRLFFRAVEAKINEGWHVADNDKREDCPSLNRAGRGYVVMYRDLPEEKKEPKKPKVKKEKKVDKPKEDKPVEDKPVEE